MQDYSRHNRMAIVGRIADQAAAIGKTLEDERAASAAGPVANVEAMDRRIDRLISLNASLAGLVEALAKAVR